MLNFLNGGSMPAGWNEIVVVLIPKVKNPVRIKDIHPISLCIVVYKLIYKILGKRLKILLPEVVSPSQSAFVLGRMITDNVLLAYV